MIIGNRTHILKSGFMDLLSSAPKELRSIAEKVVEHRRITPADALTLFSTPHISFLQLLADFDRSYRVGNDVVYASTLYIYPTNLCELACPMCSFYAKPGQAKAWFLTPEMIEDKVREALPYDLSEVHIVGGLCKSCTAEYFFDVFQRIRALDPLLPIKALTAVEHAYLARLSGISLEESFKRLISWGLTSIPGGGAEILDDSIRPKIAPKKGSTAEFLEVHRVAHRLGIPSNVTMLFDHIETPEHIVTHLDVVRRFQDETGGFDTFVPLKYQPDHNALSKIVAATPRKDCRRVFAISRLMLDNIRIQNAFFICKRSFSLKIFIVINKINPDKICLFRVMEGFYNQYEKYQVNNSSIFHTCEIRYYQGND